MRSRNAITTHIRTAALALAMFAAAAPVAAQEVVLVPNRIIYPGEAISLSALKEVTLKPGKVRPDAVATLADELDGKVAKRTLLPGRYVPVGALREAWLVDRGAAVQVIFAAGSLMITAAAVSLEPGAAGDVVKVRNLDSGKIFSGVVMADGSIHVGAT